MVSQDEYERIIESFLREMQALCASLSKVDLESHPDFVKELQESISDLCDASTSEEDIVGLAFGIVDEFVHAIRPDALKVSYKLYSDTFS